MLLFIIGWLWVVTGVIFLIWPGILKKRIQGKSNKIIKRYLFAIALFIAAGLISIGMEIQILIIKVIVILIGLAAVIKGVLMLRSKAAGAIVEFLKNKPSYLFRLWALIQAIAGALILLLR